MSPLLILRKSSLGVQGQTQLLVAMMMVGITTVIAMYSMEYSQKAKKTSYVASRRNEIHSALETAIKQVAQMYRQDAGCGPASLEAKLAYMQPDGAIGDTPSHRQLRINVNSHAYNVAFGPVRLVSEPGRTEPLLPKGVTLEKGGTSLPAQDVLIEAWTSTGTVNKETSERVGLKAVLINTCVYSCSETTSVCRTPQIPGSPTQPVYPTSALPDLCKLEARVTDPCLVAAPPENAYFWVARPETFPDDTVSQPGPREWVQTCCAHHHLGDLQYFGAPAAQNRSCGTDYVGVRGSIEMADLLILKNYLRTAETAGSCGALLSGDSDCSSCADLNGDGQVNEIDLGVMEKYLRGYLYWVPTRYASSQ